MIDCSCVSKRGKPPILPDLMHNSHLWKFINGRIIERMKTNKQKRRKKAFGGLDLKSCRDRLLGKWVGVIFIAPLKSICHRALHNKKRLKSKNMRQPDIKCTQADKNTRRNKPEPKSKQIAFSCFLKVPADLTFKRYSLKSTVSCHSPRAGRTQMQIQKAVRRVY